LNVRRSFLHDNAGQIGNKLLEVRILCNKVGLRVDLDDRAYAALIAYGRADNALSRNTVRLLGSLGETLLTQQLDRLVKVAVRLGQRLLAVHHAYVGHFTELLYVSSSKSHFLFLQKSFLQNKIVGQDDLGAPGRRALRTTHNDYAVLGLLSLSLGLLGLGLNLKLLALLAFQNSVRHGLGNQLDRADRVVVARDHVVDLVRIAVGVNDCNNRDT